METEQEILAALKAPDHFGRADAIAALVNNIGYSISDAAELVDEWIEELEWRARRENEGQEREWEWEP